jgi:hypothetical protein
MKKNFLWLGLGLSAMTLVIAAWMNQPVNSEIVSVSECIDIEPLQEISIAIVKPIPPTAETKPTLVKPATATKVAPKPKTKPKAKKDVKPLPSYLTNSLQWLVDAQFENGGWGAGLNSAQQIRDPKSVKVDPATTAFAGMALIRSGSTLKKGPYKDNVKKALEFLLDAVEKTQKTAINITTLHGTQPQSKLGQNIDVAMTAQFLARIAPLTKHDPQLSNNTNTALDKCLRILENSQQKDGSWNTAGWAPVLNSAMANNALELGQKAGRKVEKSTLDRSRNYQASNVDTETKDVALDKAAGIQLYALSSAQRATAVESKKVRATLKEADVVAEEDLETVEEVVDLLVDQGVEAEEAEVSAQAYMANRAAAERMNDDQVLSGFGNNGGEEFLSYMMTSEAYIESGDTEGWNNWHTRMSNLFGKIQNQNGSWSGHHCITSPVFCTAAIIMTLTADRDQDAVSVE